MKTRLLAISILSLLAFVLRAQPLPQLHYTPTDRSKQMPNAPHRVILPAPEPLTHNPALVNKLANSNHQTLMDTVPNDPLKVRSYVLPNGLTVLISVNKSAPRVQTAIAVKAGSKFDPAQTTGLAHYLEHMMFKGSHDFGTKDWKHESVLLDSIQKYFEWHMMEKDLARKLALYHKIDSFSLEASKYAIPNEYDKMMASIGADGSNAFTSTDMTVYVGEIPSNGLEKFLKIESNRFETCVLRLFHTELEAVYEEFNMSQDNDREWSEHAIENALLPNHPYGTQTTIGEGEHLKNPSMVNIYNYFNTYYRPNNVALILAGDVNPDSAVAMINKYFGTWQPAPVPAFEKKPEPLITQPIVREYKGPQPEHVFIGYLFDSAASHEVMMAKLVDAILANGQAGLIDLDLVQSQKLLKAYSTLEENTDYTFHILYGEPKQGQTLEQVKDLLLGEIEKIKKGDFGDWLLPAIIENMKLDRMKEAEKNENRAMEMMGAFVHNVPWKDWVNEIADMEKISKADVVKFANEHYKDNYAVCYKRMGEATVHKVEKPAITAVNMDTESESDFKKKLDEMPQPSIQPKFVDFNKDIIHQKLGVQQIPFDYIKNDLNKTFTLQYVFDMGTANMRNIGVAASFLKYLGTEKYDALQLKIEFYKLGLDFNVATSLNTITISLHGLEENLDKGVALLEELLTNVKCDKSVYLALVDDIYQERSNAKKNQQTILFGGMLNYGKYGPNNPFNDVISNEDIARLDPQELVNEIKGLTVYKHRIFYYGSNNLQTAMSVVGKYHKAFAALKDYPAEKKYAEAEIKAPNVYVCYYPMKQTEVLLEGKDVPFNKELYPALTLYNEYYGSLMFQEIREKMGLAYSVYVNYSVPAFAHQSHFNLAYIGLQNDKMKEGLAQMNKMMANLQKVPEQLSDSRINVVKTLESDWITGADMYALYTRARRLGLNEDVRKNIYEKVKNMTLADISKFFNEHIKGKKMNYLVLGKKEDIDLKLLKPLGQVKELELKEVFGY